MQFRGATDFIFNSANLSSRGWKIVAVGDDANFDFMQGQKLNVETVEGANGLTVFKSVKKENPEINFTITKADNGFNLCKITRDDLFFINRTLQLNKPKTLLVGGFEYHGIFTQLDSNINGQGIGYIKLTFKMTEPYAYTIEGNHSLRVKNIGVLDIFNKSSVNELVFPQINFQVLSGDKIKIINTRIGVACEIEGLKVQNQYKIVGELVCNETDIKDVVFPANGDFVHFVYGKNTIKIECEDCKVNISFKSKIGFM